MLRTNTMWYWSQSQIREQAFDLESNMCILSFCLAFSHRMSNVWLNNGAHNYSWSDSAITVWADNWPPVYNCCVCHLTPPSHTHHPFTHTLDPVISPGSAATHGHCVTALLFQCCIVLWGIIALTSTLSPMIQMVLCLSGPNLSGLSPAPIRCPSFLFIEITITDPTAFDGWKAIRASLQYRGRGWQLFTCSVLTQLDRGQLKGSLLSQPLWSADCPEFGERD